MPTYLYYVALAFGMVAQCLAAPAGSPHEHTAQNPSPNARQPQPVNHLQNGQHSGHHNLQQPASTATTSQSSFVDALDTFLSAYKAHPDLDALVPLPSQVGRLAGQSEQHFGHIAKASPPSQFEHDLDAFLHLYKTNHHDLDSLVPLPIHGHAALPPASDQQPAHPSSSHQSLSDSQHSSDLYLRSSPEAYGTPQSYSIHSPPPLDSSGTAKSSTVTTTTTKNQPKSNGRKKQRVTNRRKLLGKDAYTLTQRSAQYHKIDHVQARTILGRRLEKECADLLKDPNPGQFEKGAQMLPFNAKFVNVRHSLRGPKALVAEQQGRNRPSGTEKAGSSTVRGEGIRGEKRKRVAAEAEAEQGGVDLREEGSSVKKKPKVSRVKKSYADQKKMLKHAEDLIAPSVIGMMAAVYRDHTGTRSLTSHIYIRRAILKEPEQAQGLAEDMLSGQEQQIKAALHRIGCPGGKVKQPEAPLPLPDAIVERIIGQVAQHRKASRDTALQVVRKGLTAEIAKELQDPLSFQAAVDKLLFKRPYKARLPGRSVKTSQ